MFEYRLPPKRAYAAENMIMTAVQRAAGTKGACTPNAGGQANG